MNSLNNLVFNLAKIGNVFNNLNIPENLKLVRYSYMDYITKVMEYEKIYEYYCGESKALREYKMITSRSNLKINTNFIKKFIKEETSYTVGNPVTYESTSDEEMQLIEKMKDIFYDWDENHDAHLMNYLNLFTRIYELYYIDTDGNFSAKIIKPTEGYAYRDYNGETLFFVHFFDAEFEEDVEVNGQIISVRPKYIDVYTKDFIYHFNDNFEEIRSKDSNKFKRVPVSVGVISTEDYKDSLARDIAGLQDALETNLSDMGNEISDFRNAYMVLENCQFEKDEDLEEMKAKGILEVGKDGKVKWLIKDINDTFVQNTIDRYIDLIYQIGCHINHNEKLQSNLSGITLRSRLISLENKCTTLIKSHKNILKNRIRFICDYLSMKKEGDFNYKRIKIIYTPNIPQDNLSTAQMLSQVPDGVISNQTARTLFGFITNPHQEGEQVKKEMEENQQFEDESLGELYGDKHQHTEANIEE